ncbi:MAG: DUF2785 domain-containing protein [Ktedonobacterales bacterium]
MEIAFWREIVAAGYHVPPGTSAAALTPRLLPLLGSADPVARDEIAYPVFDTWIHSGAYDERALRALATQMAANLSAGVGERESDTVFLRSFSALVLMEIVNYDQQAQIFDASRLRQWLAEALAYFAEERDLRGYVPGKGWAHSVAHTADLLTWLAASQHLGAAELARILDGIAAKLRTPSGDVWMAQEDERLAYTIITVLRRDALGVDALAAWLRRLSDPAPLASWRDAQVDAGARSVYANVKSVLRSLYFQLSFAELPPLCRFELMPPLEGALRALDTGFYALP